MTLESPKCWNISSKNATVNTSRGRQSRGKIKVVKSTQMKHPVGGVSGFMAMKPMPQLRFLLAQYFLIHFHISIRLVPSQVWGYDVTAFAYLFG